MQKILLLTAMAMVILGNGTKTLWQDGGDYDPTVDYAMDMKIENMEGRRRRRQSNKRRKIKKESVDEDDGGSIGIACIA
jgi:hypothetical protein